MSWGWAEDSSFQYYIPQKAILPPPISSQSPKITYQTSLVFIFFTIFIVLLPFFLISLSDREGRGEMENEPRNVNNLSKNCVLLQVFKIKRKIFTLKKSINIYDLKNNKKLDQFKL